MTRTRILRVLILLVVGLAIASLIAYVQIKNETNRPSIVAEDFGGDFTLMDESGKIVTQNDFKNQYRLIYFGFTYCPAICPTELQRVAQVLKTLDQDKAAQIQPIFITVDPERDTSDVMKQYTAQFHPRLMGLTGTQAQIDTVKKAYKIYAAKVQDETMNDYTMDHSSFIYFIDPQDNLVRIFKTTDSLEDMIKVIQNYMP